jgi:hypothetical protein
MKANDRKAVSAITDVSKFTSFNLELVSCKGEAADLGRNQAQWAKAVWLVASGRVARQENGSYKAESGVSYKALASELNDESGTTQWVGSDITKSLVAVEHAVGHDQVIATMRDGGARGLWNLVADLAGTLGAPSSVYAEARPPKEQKDSKVQTVKSAEEMLFAALRRCQSEGLSLYGAISLATEVADKVYGND